MCDIFNIDISPLQVFVMSFSSATCEGSQPKSDGGEQQNLWSTEVLGHLTAEGVGCGTDDCS